MSKVKKFASEQGLSERELLLRLYREHKSQAGVARALGMAQGSVSIAFLRCGLRIKMERQIEAVAS